MKTLTFHGHKLVAETADLEVDLTPEIVPERRGMASYAVGDVVSARGAPGVVFIATRAGLTRHFDPMWTRDGAVRDGTVVWEPREVGEAGVPTISTVVWSSSSSAIALSGQSFAGYRVRALLSQGQAASTAQVDATVTLSTGQVLVLRWVVDINP